MPTQIRAINQAEREIRTRAQVMTDCAIAAHIEAERAYSVGNLDLHDFKQEQAEIFASYIPSYLLAEYDYYLFRALKEAGYTKDESLFG